MIRNLHFTQSLALVAFVILMLISERGLGQILTEGFESGLPTSYQTTQTTNTLGSGDWSLLNVLRNSTNQHGGLYCAQIKSANGANATTPSLNTCGVVTFWCKSGTTGSNGLKIQKSISGGVFTDVQTFTITTTNTLYTSTVSDNSADVKIRFLNMNVQTLYLDDVSITANSTGTPDIALADNGTQVAAANVNQGTSALILHKFQLGITTANATLTGMTCTTSGSYIAADITNLKVRYSADATLDGADATLSTYTNPGIAGSKTFPSFVSQSITSGTTGYIFITADIAAGAIHNNTISLNAITTSNLTFASGNKTGSTTAGGTQTFKDVTAPIVSTYSPTNGNTSVTINQDLSLTFNENIQVGTAGNIVIYNSDASVFETIPYNDGRITFSTNKVTINPTGTFSAGANYYVQVSGSAIRDIAGNYYAGINTTTTWNFTTTAPVVTNVTSTTPDGTYGPGSVINVSVTFSDIVIVGGGPRVQLETGPTDHYATYSGGSGSATLSFDYTVQTTDVTADLNYKATTSLGLNGGTINSPGGIAATLTLPALAAPNSLASQKAIVIDGVAPTVNTYSPTDGNTSVTINQNLVLTFNENVKAGTSGSIIIYNSVGTVFETIPYDDARITFSTNTVTINPTSVFSYSSDYYVQISGSAIKDMYDNSYAGINTTTTWNFTTECGPVSSFPYTIDFSSYLPTCWSETVGLLAAPSTLSGITSTWSEDGYANTGSTGSASINIYGTSAKEWLITPTIDLGSTTDYQLEFDLALTDYNNTNPITSDPNGTTGADDKFAVVISTDNGITWSSANILKIWDNAGSSNIYNNLTPAGTHVTIILASYTGQVKIGFYGESTISNADNDLFIDNVLITQMLSCVMPTAVTSSSVMATSATISWTASISNPSNGYQYEVRTSGTAGSGTTGLIIAGTTTAGDVNDNLTGLAANTTYNVFVRSDCSGGDFSAWTSAYSFLTLNLPPPTATAANNINSTGFTANWGSVATATGYKLDVYTGTSSPANLIEGFEGYTNATPPSGWTLSASGSNINSNVLWSHGGTYYISLSTVDAWAQTPQLTDPTILTFWGRASGTTSDFTVKVQTSPDGSNWTDKATYIANTTNTGSVTNIYTQYTVNLNMSGNYYIRWFIFARGSVGSLYLDDVAIAYTGSSNTYTLQDQSVSGTSYAVTGLNNNTQYHYVVRAVNASSTSANSNVIDVTTYGTKISTSAGDWNTISWAPAGTPIATDNVTIDHAVTLSGSADCNDLTINTGKSLSIASGASIITHGSTVQGTASMDHTITANKYHSFSPSITGTAAGIFYIPGTPSIPVYLYSHTEANNANAQDGYFEISDETTPLVVMDGYGLYADGTNATPNPVSSWTFTENGTLNNGIYFKNLTKTGSGVFSGFNYVGNPYPSYINWNTGNWTKTNISATTYIENAGNWATYASPGPGVNNGSNIIAPGQGFFVKVPSGSAGYISMDNSVRTNTSTPYLKSSPTNYVRLIATGNNKTDETVVRFDSDATPQYDAEYDANKLSASELEFPQIYSIADTKLAYNALPETNLVQLGFNAGITGTYTIGVNAIDGMQYVTLEDTKTGIFTELANKSYTFNFTAGENEQRFKLHFSALDVVEKEASTVNIYSYQQTVYINLNENVKGDIYIYNIAGQQVASKLSAQGMNEIKLSNTGNYIVKVISKESSVVRKVFIK